MSFSWRQRLTPRVVAISSRLGSTLASAADRLRYIMGYRCMTSRATTIQNMLSPDIQLMGLSIMPKSRRSMLTEPIRAKKR